MQVFKRTSVYRSRGALFSSCQRVYSHLLVKAKWLSCRLKVVGTALLFCFLPISAAQPFESEGPRPPAKSIQSDSSSLPLTQDAIPLRPGAPLERELKGGASQSFTINLSAGEFLYVAVEQKGIDVALTLLGPDGKAITKVDSSNGSWGPEPVVEVAKHPGEYRLEVRSGNPRVAPGKYEIKIHTLRPATGADYKHVAAERTIAEGDEFRALRTAASRAQAVEKYSRALQFLEDGADHYRHAVVLLRIGLTHADSSEFRQALEAWRKTLSLAKTFGYRYLEASALTNLGVAHDILGDVHKSLDYYAQALTLHRATGNKLGEFSTLNNIGKVHSESAEWHKAMEHYNRALPLIRGLGDRREAIFLQNIGVVLNSTGEHEKALDFFNESLTLRRAIADKAGEADGLKEVASAHHRLGDAQKALEYGQQALTLWQQVGDKRYEAFTLDNIGLAYAKLNQLEKALEQHQQALKLQQAIENRRGQGISTGNIASVFTLMGQREKATLHYREALSIFRTLEDQNSVAEMLQGMARNELDEGRCATAREHIEEAISLIEEVRSAVGAQQARASYFASKLEAYELYIDLLMQMHRATPSAGYDAKALAISERARARSLIELLNQAEVDIRQGVDAALLQREREVTREINAKAQRQIQLLGQKNTEQRLLELKKEIRALESEFQLVKQEIHRSSPAYAALTQPQPLGLKEIQEQLDSDTLLLEYSLGQEHSYLWAVTKNSHRSYELPKRELIQKSARRVYELLTTRSVSKAGETSAQKQRRLAEADSHLLAASRELSAMVLGPVTSELGNKRLVVIPDGALQYVPFAVLPVVRNPITAKTSTQATSSPKGRPLVLDHEITTLPSASALAVQRKTLVGRKPAPKTLAVIADPVFSIADERLNAEVRGVKVKESMDAANGTRILEHLAEDTSGKLKIRRLRFTRQEAEEIMAVAPRAANFKALDFKANRATAMAPELGQYRYVHFATHGYLDNERADLSAIVLSMVDEQGNSQDGFLRTHEIYNLNLPAELVVLSACQTGLGKEIRGEGLVGLTRGFMYAGARRVVVSLWSVNDKATAELMRRFYHGMLIDKLTPAAALRRAQAQMARHPQWHSPYYWAAFVLQGEWR